MYTIINPVVGADRSSRIRNKANRASRLKALHCNDSLFCARVVELADSLDSGSSVQYVRAGSSPASRTIEIPCSCNDYRAFSFARKYAVTLISTLNNLLSALFNTLYKCVHSGCAVLFHLFSCMTVNVKGKCCCMVSKIFLDGFYIITR